MTELLCCNLMVISDDINSLQFDINIREVTLNYYLKI